MGFTWYEATGQAAFSYRYGTAGVTFNNEMWLIGGYDGGNLFNDAWYSSDGNTWTATTTNGPFSQRAYHSVINFDDGGGAKIWVIGGDNLANQADVWSSPDGWNWSAATTVAPFGTRKNFGGLVFGSPASMWVIGGYDPNSNQYKNDVWASVDGVNWTLKNPAAPFSPRSNFGCVVFNGKIWVVGGHDNQYGHTDVWSSVDGVSWTQETPNANFSNDAEYHCVVQNGNIWLLCSQMAFNTWYSSDGISWIQANPGIASQWYFGYAALSFNSSIWMIGGSDSSVGIKQVWYSP
jgi:hypothetical protein